MKNEKVKWLPEGMLRLCFLFVGMLLALTAYTNDLPDTLFPYGLENWTVERGLPSNTVNTVLQSRDGYLWMGTMGGVIRFDGARFVTFNSLTADAFKNNNIRTLLEDQEGNLWAGTDDGLLKFKAGQFFDATPPGLRNTTISCLLEDSNGGLFIGTTEKGVFRIYNDSVTHYNSDAGLSNPRVRNLYEDHSGNLLISTDGGLNSLKNGKITVYTQKDGLLSDVLGVIRADRENTLWIATQRGLNCFKNGIITTLAFPQEHANKGITSLYIDHENAFWIGVVNSGLLYFKDGKFTTILPQEDSLRDLIYSIIEVEEGIMWIGTANFGLNMLRPLKFTTIAAQEGLSSDKVLCVYEDHQQNIWIGTYEGLNQWKNHHNRILTTQDGLSNNTITALCEDHAKNLWIGTLGGGLACWKNDTFTIYTKKEYGLASDTIWSLNEDYSGNLWIGTSEGLTRLKDGVFNTYTTKNGLSDNVIRFILPDRKHNLWLGTQGGLNRFKEGNFKVYNTDNGLSDNIVTHIYLDQDEALWIGTVKGLNRLKDDTITTYYLKDGLYNEKINQIFEDEKKFLWFGSAAGIFRIKKKELNDFAEGRLDNIHPYSYNERDGMKSTVCVGGCQPAGYKSQDGKLWFPTLIGVTIVDPNQLPVNTLLPPTIIEELFVDGEKIDISNSSKSKEAVFPPGKKRFEFHYTALSFLNPKKIRFKYKLTGYDQDWIEAGNQRSTIYTGLPARHYEFNVIACNDDGIWNIEGAALSFYLKPYFYQTVWFYILMALFVVLAAFFGFRFRLNQLKAREKQLKTQVQLRTQDLQIANEKLFESKKIIEEKNQHILDSIQYAGKIQNAILRINEQMKNVLSDHFVIFMPRDIVSGDFYWFGYTGDEYFIAVADCTGHGVPGALLSMIGIMELNDLVNKKQISDPALILYYLHQDFRDILQQGNEFTDTPDGMDIGLCLIDMKMNRLTFAGAKRPLIIVSERSHPAVIEKGTQEPQRYKTRNTEQYNLSFIKGDRKSIGGHQKEYTRTFKNVDISIYPGTTLYLLSDGLVDQVNANENKFGYRRLESFLMAHAHLPMEEQKKLLLDELKQFQADEEQRDDITLVGIKLKT